MLRTFMRCRVSSCRPPPPPPVLQYMTHRNRLGRLERGAQLYNERQKGLAVERLCAMTVKAERELGVAAQKQEQVLSWLHHMHGIGREQVCSRRGYWGGTAWAGLLRAQSGLQIAFNLWFLHSCRQLTCSSSATWPSKTTRQRH